MSFHDCTSVALLPRSCGCVWVHVHEADFSSDVNGLDAHGADWAFKTQLHNKTSSLAWFISTALGHLLYVRPVVRGLHVQVYEGVMISHFETTGVVSMKHAVQTLSGRVLDEAAELAAWTRLLLTQCTRLDRARRLRWPRKKPSRTFIVHHVLATGGARSRASLRMPRTIPSAAMVEITFQRE